MIRAFLVLMLLGAFSSAFAAGLSITKIMYDPPGANAGHQWIEITNTGASAIDLGAKDLRLFDESGNHLLRAYEGGSMLLQSGSSAVISQNPRTYLNDHPSYNGPLLKSAFSLSSTAGFVGILQIAASGTPETVLAHASYAAPVKLSTAKTGTSKRTSSPKTGKRSKATSATNSKNAYGKGTVAPASVADAPEAGALPAYSFSLPQIPYLSVLSPFFASAWFAAFLGLLAFSTFSLILIQRHLYI